MELSTFLAWLQNPPRICDTQIAGIAWGGRHITGMIQECYSCAINRLFPMHQTNTMLQHTVSSVLWFSYTRIGHIFRPIAPVPLLLITIIFLQQMWIEFEPGYFFQKKILQDTQMYHTIMIFLVDSNFFPGILLIYPVSLALASML